MLCAKCGAEVAEDARFCTSCGEPVGSVEPAPSPPACPQCGSALSPGQDFCSNCGYRLTAAPVRSVSPPGTSLARRLTSVIMVTVAAVMILVAIALPWYADRYWGYTENITFGDLMDSFNGGDWWGIALPAIVLVAIAGVILITAIISFVIRKNMNALWSSLGSLAMVGILANAGYLIWSSYDYYGEWVNIVHAGSILVFIASIVLMVGASIRPRKL